MTDHADTPMAQAFEARLRATRPMAGPYWVSEKDLPADTGWAEYDQARAARFALVGKRRKTYADLAKVQRDKQLAASDYPQRAAEALRAGKAAPKDPTPKLTEREQQLEAELAIIDQALDQDADELRALVHRQRNDYLAQNEVMLAVALDEAEDARLVLVAACDRVYRIKAQDNWLRGGKFVAGTLGSTELNRLGDLIDKARQPPDLVYVDPENFAKVKRQVAAVAVDGTPLPEGTPVTAVTLTYSPKGSGPQLGMRAEVENR